MRTAIYTRVIMCKDEPYKPQEIEVSHRRENGTWHREKGYTYHHGAPSEYSHEQAARAYRFSHVLYDGDYSDLHYAPANDGKHDFIFI